MFEVNPKNETWLILAHCFNMDGRAASQTITDRIPYFLKRGILPVVLSAPTGAKDNRFPHHCVLSLAPSGILFEMRQIIEKHFPDSFFQKILKALLTILCFPFYLVEKLFIHLDSQWSWFMSASVKGFFLIKSYRPELIYSTAGPPSTHLASFLLQKIFCIPWLAEVHDPLVYNNVQRKNQRYWFNKWIERIIFRHATAVVYFTEKALETAKVRNLPRRNTYVLRSGADSPDISGVHYEERKRIHFGHFGSLAEDRNLSEFMRGLYELLKERPDLKDRVCLDIYGADLDPVSRRCFAEYPLGDVLQAHGRLEYDSTTGKTGRHRVLEAMRRCDVLLLIHGTDVICEEYIPSKLYEYLLTGRPIFGLTSSGSEVGRILIDTGHVVANGGDIKAVKKNIGEYIKRWETKGLPDNNVTSPFTIESAVENLLNIVEPILKKEFN